MMPRRPPAARAGRREPSPGDHIRTSGGERGYNPNGPRECERRRHKMAKRQLTGRGIDQ
jgi:hypothetical protein